MKTDGKRGGKITKILSKPYRQFFRYWIDVEFIDKQNRIKKGSLPSTNLEYIKKCKVGDEFCYAENIEYIKTKKEEKGIKTFLAKKRPEEFKVFQFTKEMLPKRDKKVSKIQDYNIQGTDKITVQFSVRCDGTICCSLIYWGGYYHFEVGDYIGEQEGNYFVIERKEFEKDWVVVK